MFLVQNIVQLSLAFYSEIFSISDIILREYIHLSCDTIKLLSYNAISNHIIPNRNQLCLSHKCNANHVINVIFKVHGAPQSYMASFAIILIMP